MARATKRQAQSALRAIRKHFGFAPGDEGGPRLVEEYHGWYSSYPNAIVWEDGPYEWAVAIRCGCTGCGDSCKLLAADKLPKGTYVEAINGEALSLYRL
jgi:hypothetical protein